MRSLKLEDSKSIDRAYFDNYGDEGYSKTYKKYTFSPEYIIEDLVDNNLDFETVLDVGCASGELVRDFRDLDVEAFGIENNPDILENNVAREYCVLMDMLDMSTIKDETFSVVYTNACMYLEPTDVLEVLKEMHRICSEGVYLCCPFLDTPDMFRDPYRKFLASREWWQKQFTAAGFEKATDNLYLKS